MGKEIEFNFLHTDDFSHRLQTLEKDYFYRFLFIDASMHS